jgi:uncharacterized membrane protein YgcG
MIYRRLITVLAFVAFSVLSSSARADVAPPDACNLTDVGKACSNAGPSYDQPGICTATKCTKYNPDDGGIFEYDCALCKLEGDAGMTGSSTSGASGSTSGAGSASTGSGGGSSATGGDSGSAKDPTDESSCTLTAGHREGAAAALLLVIGLGALGWARRREGRA